MISLDPSCLSSGLTSLASPDLAWPELELANRNPIQTRKKKIHWNKTDYLCSSIYQDHLAPGHAQVCCSKVSTEEAIIEAAREVRVRADHGLGPQSSPHHRAEEPTDSLKCKLRTIINWAYFKTSCLFSHEAKK